MTIIHTFFMYSNISLSSERVHTAMLCSVNYIFFNIKLFKLLLNIIVIEAALPPGTEDEIVLIEHLPGRQIHLQDFFWTNADDAPSWLDPDQTLNFYETRTVHHTATVYQTDDEQDPTKLPVSGPIDPGCVNCIEPTATLNDPDQDMGVLVGDDPGPRYWLLTVLRPGENVPPKIELKLARLYRAAFARQQQRHLGLLSIDPRLRRAAKGIITTENYNPINNEKINTSINTVQSSQKINTTQVKKMRQINLSSGNKYFRTNRASENYNIKPTQSPQYPDYSTTKTKDKLSSTILTLTKTTTTVFTDNEIILQSQNQDSTSKLTNDDNNITEITTPDYLILKTKENNNKTLQTDIFSSEKINLNVQNISTLIVAENINNTDDDYDKNKLLTNITSDSYKLQVSKIELVQVRMQNTSILDDGSTRLIYSVHLDGKPVPAETAAKDMSLLSSQEVALELGAPVIIQSEPYLKVTQPLALSRKRDAILLVGAAGVSLIILIILAAIIIVVKKKKIQSSVSAPPTQSILKKNTSEYTPTTPGFDNTGYTSETEERTDGTSQRQTPGGNSRSLDTLVTPNTLNRENQDLSSENDEENDDVDDEDDDDKVKKDITTKRRVNDSWNSKSYTISEKEKSSEQRKIIRTNVVEKCESDSEDSLVDQQDEKNLKVNKNEFIQTIEETGSTHSYLSMPSCKLFPNMKSVEPLSKILEPVVIQPLDMEFESPEMPRKENIFIPRDNKQLHRTRSAYKDPGVIGPIVWDLRRQQKALSETPSQDVERQQLSSGPVGRARRRLHELLEDSLNLFGTMKDTKMKDQSAVSSTLHPNSMVTSPDHLTINSESQGKSTQVSPVESPMNQMKNRPQTSLARNMINQELIIETGTNGVQARGAWGSRPLSAGPFHRPILPEVNVTRILTDTQLAPEDPAVPLIAAIRKELEKFTPN
ncbi:hypothetical protein HCN44_003243 [Aphidius gifuensis]|uniref:Uncharacterized protein n=1 Tax=Aphidius gifuensis TaxID=684658 RepID=A0A834XMJ8_APHGI|nr:uncharacterized protein LOC122859079 [Aphidius gifuensis]KAF7987481.1 hypothetical protein HCN44_003243 [Aphidius gifuensis]